MHTSDPIQELWHGDSRALHAIIDGPIHCICTDPPYGMNFKSGSAQSARSKAFVSRIENDDDPDLAAIVFLDAVGPLVEKTADECEMYVFTRWNLVGLWTDVINSLEPFVVKNLLIWEKGNPGMGDVRANWSFSYECILYAKKGRRPIPNRRSSIIHVERVNNKRHVHPTQKPVPLLEILLNMSTNPGDLVVDPFAGSGSTIQAARNLGRNAIGIEADEVHFNNAQNLLKQRVFSFE